MVNNDEKVLKSFKMKKKIKQKIQTQETIREDVYGRLKSLLGNIEEKDLLTKCRKERIPSNIGIILILKHLKIKIDLNKIGIEGAKHPDCHEDWKSNDCFFSRFKKTIKSKGYYSSNQTTTPTPKVTKNKSKSIDKIFTPMSKVDVSSNEFLNTFEWKKLRALVLQKYGRRCMCCGNSPNIDNDVIMHVDHIKPRKYYPELALDFDNLQILCSDCNWGKGNWLIEDFRTGFCSTKDEIWSE